MNWRCSCGYDFLPIVEACGVCGDPRPIMLSWADETHCTRSFYQDESGYEARVSMVARYDSSGRSERWDWLVCHPQELMLVGTGPSLEEAKRVAETHRFRWALTHPDAPPRLDKVEPPVVVQVLKQRDKPKPQTYTVWDRLMKDEI